MSFVNEYISPGDVEKYGLEEIDRQFIGGTRARDWTIDRERGMYLRNVSIGAGGDPDFRGQTLWTFYWQGTPLTVRLDLLDGGGEAGESGWSRWKLVYVNGSFGLPASLTNKKHEFLHDLRESLTAYRGGGVFSADYRDYRVMLDIGEECVL